MKNMTLWQRLNTALLLLILLLLVGVGLAVWGERTSANAELHDTRLKGTKDRIWLNTVRLSEAVRELAGQVKTDAGKKRERDVEREAVAELKNGLDELQKKPFSEYRELQSAAKKLHDFVLGNAGALTNFHRRVLELAESDPAAAMAHFDQNYSAIRDQRDELFKELRKQVENVQADEAKQAATISLLSSAGIV